MKRFLALICSGATALALCTFFLNPSVSAEPITSQTPATTEELIYVTSESKTEKFSDEKGTELLSLRYDKPVVKILGNPVASAAIDKTLDADRERILVTERKAQDIEAALENARFLIGKNYSFPFFMQHTFFVKCGGSNVLCLENRDSIYFGGQHEYVKKTAQVFDTKTGSPILLADITNDLPAFGDFVTEKIIALSKDAVPSEGYYAGYEELIPQSIVDGLWYFSDKGITFIYNPYVLGPYALGVLEFTIPYSELSGKIFDRFLPSPSASPVGTLMVERVENSDIEPLFSVTADENGQLFALRANGTLRNVRLDHVTSPDGVTFYELGELAFINTLKDGEAFYVKALLPETMPNLRVSYDTPDGQTSKYLAESGQDGSVILIDLAT